MYRNDWSKSRKRAREAHVHGARHTFIEPEALLHLIAIHRDFLKLRRLVNRAGELAEQEQVGGYESHVLWKWIQTLDALEDHDPDYGS